MKVITRPKKKKKKTTRRRKKKGPKEPAVNPL